MRKELEEILDKKFTLPMEEGESKLCDLNDAVAKQVKPGMLLYFPFSQIRVPSAPIYEITRQFWGQKGDFVIACLASNYPLSILIHGGLVKKVISGACGDPYYYPAPSKIYQRAFKANGVEIENCSLLTYTQRMQAGAMGLPFMPSKSLIGSSIYEEDKDNIQIIDDPFGSGQKLSLVKAIQPDLAIVHALAADSYGNAIYPPPLGDNLYGALGSKGGVLLTVDKIVSTEFIRGYSHFVKLPGYLVNSVSEVPMGAHPGGIHNPGIKGLCGYAEDYDFYDEVHNASEDPDRLDDWIKEWILDCKDHNAYLRKLGHKRIRFLKGKAHSDSWRYELEDVSDSLDSDGDYNPIEMMIVTASRKLVEKARQNNYRIILAGGGMSYLTAAMATYALREEKYEIDMMVETGLLGVLARPGEPHLLSHLAFATCKMLADVDTMMGIFMGGASSRCIGSLAAAEIDKNGSINTTRDVARDIFIMGSGGSNDICSAAREVVTTIRQSRSRFLDKVSYVTSPGSKVKTIVSTLGVFEKLGEDEEFSLTGYFPSPKLLTRDESVSNIKEHCGWDLKVSPNVAEVSPPTAEELRTLRLLDAHRYNIGK